MYALNEEDTELQQSKSMLFALFHRSKKSKDIDWGELAEFTLERLTAEPYLGVPRSHISPTLQTA
jgi:hypothetical protein